MWGILHMTPWSLRTAGNYENYEKRVRVRAWIFLQNGIQNFVIYLFLRNCKISRFKKGKRLKRLAMKIGL